MRYNILEDIKTISELKTRTRAVVQHVRSTRRPVVVTIQGRPAVVLLDAGEHERQQQILDLALLLAEGERDVREGRVRPAREFLAELPGGKKLRR